MALKFFTTASEGTYICYGLSTDTKPASPPDSCLFIEIDTAKRYLVSGGAWVEAFNNAYPKTDGTGKISVGTVTPTSPATGDLWVDTN